MPGCGDALGAQHVAAVAAVVGLDAADRGDQRPLDVAGRVGGVDDLRGALVGGQRRRRDAVGRGALDDLVLAALRHAGGDLAGGGDVGGLVDGLGRHRAAVRRTQRSRPPESRRSPGARPGSRSRPPRAAPAGRGPSPSATWSCVCVMIVDLSLLARRPVVGVPGHFPRDVITTHPPSGYAPVANTSERRTTRPTPGLGTDASTECIRPVRSRSGGVVAYRPVPTAGSRCRRAGPSARMAGVNRQPRRAGPVDGPAPPTLFERARAVTPGGVNSPVRAFNAVGGHAAVHRERRTGPTSSTSTATSTSTSSAPGGRCSSATPTPRSWRRSPQAAARGTSYGTPTEAEVELAEEIVGRTPVDTAAAGVLGHRGDDVGDPAGPRLHRPRRGGEVRRLLPRPRRLAAGLGRLRAGDLRGARHARGARRTSPSTRSCCPTTTPPRSRRPSPSTATGSPA